MCCTPAHFFFLQAEIERWPNVHKTANRSHLRPSKLISSDLRPSFNPDFAKGSLYRQSLSLILLLSRKVKLPRIEIIFPSSIERPILPSRKSDRARPPPAIHIRSDRTTQEPTNFEPRTIPKVVAPNDIVLPWPTFHRRWCGIRTNFLEMVG